jgi:hypothetical protein
MGRDDFDHRALETLRTVSTAALEILGHGYNRCETEVLLQQPGAPKGSPHLDGPGHATVALTVNLSEGHASTFFMM